MRRLLAVVDKAKVSIDTATGIYLARATMRRLVAGIDNAKVSIDTATGKSCWSAGLICICAGLAGCATPTTVSLNHGWFGGGTQTAKKTDDGPAASPKLHLSWAKLQEREGNLTDARNSYAHVLEHDPKSLDAILGVARLDYFAHRFEDAEHGFQKAVKLAPQSPVALTALGEFYVAQERWDEAIAALTSATLAAPDEKTYRYQLAVALTKAGRADQALPHFSMAVGAAEAHYNIGRILYDQGNIPASEEQFLLAVTKNPELDPAQYWLDEVRREREAKVILSNAATVSTQAPAARPSTANARAPVSPVTPALVPLTPNPPPAWQPAAHSAAPLPSAGSFAPLGSPPPRDPSSAAPGANPALSGTPPRIPANPAGPPGVSPQQLEQMRNQRNANLP